MGCEIPPLTTRKIFAKVACYSSSDAKAGMLNCLVGIKKSATNDAYIFSQADSEHNFDPFGRNDLGIVVQINQILARRLFGSEVHQL